MFIDIVESRLNIAKKLGADSTYLVQKNRSEKDAVADIHTIFEGEPNRAIDASGAQASIRLAILVSYETCLFLKWYYLKLVGYLNKLDYKLYLYQATKSGGVVVVVGMGSPDVQIPLMNALTREIDIRGVFRYVNK